MVKRLTREQAKQLFHQFNDGDGLLSMDQVCNAVKKWCPVFDQNPAAIRRACRSADLNQNGLFEFAEFNHLVEILYNYLRIRELFQNLDKNKDHQISFEEFKEGHDLLEEKKLDEKHLKGRFECIDKDRLGTISFDEFCLYMSKKKMFST